MVTFRCRLDNQGRGYRSEMTRRSFLSLKGHDRKTAVYRENRHQERTMAVDETDRLIDHTMRLRSMKSSFSRLCLMQSSLGTITLLQDGIRQKPEP